MKLFVLLCILIAVCAEPIRFRRESETTPTTPAEPRILSLHSVSTIRTRFAHTVIVSVLENPGNDSLLATFSATLPDDAFISNFSMTIKDKVIVGDVKEKEKAKEVFDAAVAAGQSAGHVAQRARETNIFDISVNVGAGENVRFELVYQEVLQRVHGVYKHAVNIGTRQVIPDLRVHVSLAESRKITTLHVPEVAVKVAEKNNKDLVKAPEAKGVQVQQTESTEGSFAEIDYKPNAEQQKAALGDKEGLTQLVVLYDVERSDDAGELLLVDGYFVHFFAPTNITVAPKRIVFVIDISGSMAGTKLQQTKDAMVTILNDLNEADQFNLVIFDDEVEVWTTEFQPKGKVPAAIDYVRSLRDDGSTNINEAMLEAIRQFQGKVRTGDCVIFLTDGQPTSGETGTDAILSNIKKELKTTPITIHSISFGEGADYDLLKSISLLANGGLAKKVYEDSDATLQMEGFYAQIGNPLLSDVKLKYLNASLEPNSLVSDSGYNLYEGSEIVTLGKLAASQNAHQADQFAVEADAQSASGARVMRCMPIPPPCFFRPLEGPTLDDEVAKLIWVPPHCPPYPWPVITTTERPPPDAKSLAGYLERMWAKKTIDKLLSDEKYAEGKSAEDKKGLKKKALDLSLKYNFVTELTSMVVVQNNETKPLGETKPQATFDSNRFGSAFGPNLMAMSVPGSSGRFGAAGLPGPPPPMMAIGTTTMRARPTMAISADEAEEEAAGEAATEIEPEPVVCSANSTEIKINGVFLFECPENHCPIGYECIGNSTCCSDPNRITINSITHCSARHTYFSPCVEYEYTCAEVKQSNVTELPRITAVNHPTCSNPGCVCLDTHARNENGECVPHARC